MSEKRWEKTKVVSSDFFHKTIEMGVTYENVLTFEEVARYIIYQYEKGNEGVIKKSFTSKTVLIKVPDSDIGGRGMCYIYPNGRPDLFTSCPDENKNKGNCLTDEKVFNLVVYPQSLSYKGEFIYNDCSNHFIHSFDKIKQALQGERRISDDLLLVALVGGDSELAYKLMKIMDIDLTDLHVTGVGHDMYLTQMVGICNGEIVALGGDNYFDFLITC